MMLLVGAGADARAPAHSAFDDERAHDEEHRHEEPRVRQDDADDGIERRQADEDTGAHHGGRVAIPPAVT
ncbi:hypothetical protein [Mycobacterium marinum]|uniref:hypothetical protein n=1 Tax=Mycobacterium marinum TaxID=1781 RepID=UPI0021C33417|nr:hypothetical protein [Mycobacterium marinum]